MGCTLYKAFDRGPCFAQVVRTWRTRRGRGADGTDATWTIGWADGRTHEWADGGERGANMAVRRTGGLVEEGGRGTDEAVGQSNGRADGRTGAEGARTRRFDGRVD